MLRAPHWNPALRGSFAELALAHGRGHLARAVYEGTACSIRDALGVLGDEADSGEAPAVVGGGARSAVWVRILAGVLERPLRPLPDADSALGAALLGRDALGLPSAPALAARADPPVVPDPAQRTTSRALYQRYRALQPRLFSLYG